MKKFLVCLLLVFASTAVFAHAPSDITITAKDALVNVVVDHATKDPAKHFIYFLTLTVNGKKLISQEFTRQESDKQQKAVFYVPGLKTDDIIEVTANCNMGGELTAKYTVK